MGSTATNHDTYTLHLYPQGDGTYVCAVVELDINVTGATFDAALDAAHVAIIEQRERNQEKAQAAI